MSVLAQQGNRVLFIENTGVRRVAVKDYPRLKSRFLNWKKGVKGIRKVRENLYVYAPLVLPFPYSKIARVINKVLIGMTIRRWVRTMQFENPIVWTWLPTGLSSEVIRFLNAQLVIYYCADNFEASSAGAKNIRKTENDLIQNADLVFVTSKALFDRCSQLTGQVHMFPYGFNHEIFGCEDDLSATDIESIKRPILGYVGGVHKFIDFELVKKIALAHPDKSLVFVGPLQTNVRYLANLPNVHFLGQKQYEMLPAYIKHFDLCLIPYVKNEYTRNVYPTKMNEYLFMGKPVVSTQLPEVEYFNQCHDGVVLVAESYDIFLLKIREGLSQCDPVLATHRIKVAESNAWSKKIEVMNALIQAKLMEKVKARESNWQYTLKQVYESSRQKIFATIATCLIAYVLTFHTSLVWILAKPLRVMDLPVQSDAIVVLAGGIGESGIPGEAYQEKVKQAVFLYREGYAKKVILLSGAGHVFLEAQIMKALAVSLGIPGNAVILDKRGGGNYVSLINTKKIMEDQGWGSMLLITSRYNSLRSQLILKKNFSGITVRFVPASLSAFFGEQEKVQFKHVRAILHEYLGIIYYWIKGYI